jgi:hypothetical protein
VLHFFHNFSRTVFAILIFALRIFSGMLPDQIFIYFILSVSVSDPDSDSIGSVDPTPACESGPGSRQVKIVPKKEKNEEISCLKSWRLEASSGARTEGVSETFVTVF